MHNHMNIKLEKIKETVICSLRSVLEKLKKVYEIMLFECPCQRSNMSPILAYVRHYKPTQK